MKTYSIRLTDEAEADVKNIYSFIREQSSPQTARAYVNRLLGFLARFDVFPERGRFQPDIGEGVRIVGFERRVAVAFKVEATEIVILRLLYAGRMLRL